MTSPAPRRAVLFDMDDTLLLTREVKWDHHRFVAREHYGIELDDQTLRAHWGEPFDEMIGKGRLHGVRLEGTWLHVGTPESIRQALRKLLTF